MKNSSTFVLPRHIAFIAEIFPAKSILTTIIYSGIVLLINYFYFNEISSNSLKFTNLIAISFLTSATFVNRFSDFENTQKRRIVTIFLESFILTFGLLSLLILFFGLRNFDRNVILFSCMTIALSELFTLFYYLRKNKIEYTKSLIFSKRIFAIQFLLLLVVFYSLFIRYFDERTFNCNCIYFISLCLVGWLAITLTIHNFNNNSYKNYWTYIYPRIKEIILLILWLIFLLSFFQINITIAKSFLIGIGIYGATLFVLMLFFYEKVEQDEADISRVKLIKATNMIDFKIENYFKKTSEIISNTNHVSYSDFRQKLKNVYLLKFAEIFNFLDASLDLQKHTLIDSHVIRSKDIYNIEILPDEKMGFILNLQAINDIKRINKYLIEVNKKLKKDGIYASFVQPIALRYNKFIQEYPLFVARFLYFLDFLWHRVLPKIPILQKIYFFISNGNNRAIPLAECLGRLYYCGFEVVSATQYDNKVFFIAKKKHQPKEDKNPSYGPFFKMKRLGKGGKTIYVYKARTMHPYSEYIQDYVYSLNQLAKGGKFKDDFRITSWGKFLRKLWLDELPMLINWFKGDLKIVGIRPLSEHYLSLYDEDFRKRRIKYKPGLFPPYYVDLPQTLEEIQESEKKYLDAYDKNPIITDLKYFFIALYNIVVKKARSS